MSGMEGTVHMVQRLQANDHFYLTAVLMCLCLLLGFNVVGALCLMPALLCAAVVCCCYCCCCCCCFLSCFAVVFAVAVVLDFIIYSIVERHIQQK